MQESYPLPYSRSKFKNFKYVYYNQIVGNISANIYTEENVEGFLEDFDRVLTQYNETTLPNKKCDILIEFLRGFVGDVLQSISHSIK